MNQLSENRTTGARVEQGDPKRAFENLPREHGFEPLEVEGALPADLAAVLYRNGPGLNSLFGHSYKHWFDGDGAVSAVRMSEGRAEGAVRLVQSEGLQYERRKGRRMTSGYSEVAPGIRPMLGALNILPRNRVFKNAANTSVMVWQQRLLALWEAGLPTELDPSTLETLGETNFDGTVLWGFTAHPHYVPARRATYAFGMRYLPGPRLDLFELPDAGPARRLHTLKLPRPTMIHDAAVTDRHFVFFISPLRFRMMRAGFGFGSFSDNMMWEPELGTEVVVVPLDQPDRPIRMQTEPFFQWHFANAYERRSHSGGSNGEIAVDLVRYPDFRSNRYVGQLKDGEMQVDPEPAFWRAVLDLQARRIVWEKRNEERGEFPRIHPDYQGCHYRYAWMAGHSHHTVARERPWDVLARMDVETGERRVVGLDGGGVPSEPILLPRSGDEEDGYLLTLVYDPGRHASYVAVLDARRFEEGPVARVWFDHHIPPTLHGAAVPLP